MTIFNLYFHMLIAILKKCTGAIEDLYPIQSDDVFMLHYTIGLKRCALLGKYANC